MASGPLGGLRPLPSTAPEVTLGLGPASVKVVVPGWRRLLRPFRRPPLSDRVRVLPGHARLSVLRSDEGRFECGLAVVNVGRRALAIDRVDIDQWLWRSEVMPLPPARVRGAADPIPPGAVRQLLIDVPLTPGAIRRVLESTRPARNVWSTPEARSSVLAEVRVRSEARPFRIEVGYPVVEVDAVWTPAGTPVVAPGSDGGASLGAT